MISGIHIQGMPLIIYYQYKSQQNLLLIEYQRVKYFEECNC